MADTSKAVPKRERKRARAERLRAEQRRRQRRRTIGYTLSAIALIALSVAVIASSSGGGSVGSIRPSAASQVQVSGPVRTAMLAVGDAIPSFSAPGFHMEAADGGYDIVRGRVDWADYSGSPTVLTIWASWCPHCQRELPILASAVAGAPDVRLVSVVTSIGAHPGPTPEGYLSDEGLTFPVAIDDEAATIARALGLQAFPTLYLVDSDGTIAYAHEGEVPEDVLTRELASLS